MCLTYSEHFKNLQLCSSCVPKLMYARFWKDYINDMKLAARWSPASTGKLGLCCLGDWVTSKFHK